MKISIKEGEQICKDFNLGKIKSIEAIPSGWSNYNFELKTNKNDYIIQIFGRKIDKWKNDKLELQFSLLEYLNGVNFPYSVPFPIKNSNLKYISKIKSKPFWIYTKISGDTYQKISKKQFRECAKALAMYHKFLKGFKFKTKYEDFDNFDWILKRYKQMKKVKPKNKTDILMLKNLSFFEEVVNKLKKIDFGKNRIFCHSDWHNENILFKKDQITGIIDFDDVQVSPRVCDITIAMVRCRYLGKFYSEKKKKIFLKEYRKIMPFNKKEEELILPILLKNNAVTFWWFYEGMEKNQDKKYFIIKNLIKETKNNYSSLTTQTLQ